MIPLVDLAAQHAPIETDIKEAINTVIAKSQFIMGAPLASFEKNFASFCKRELCVGVSSGSSALYVVLQALGISPGDEVIMPTNTFAATAFAVSMLGATPVFVDIEKDTLLVDVAQMREAITPKTKALLPVHMYGAVSDMDAINALAKEHDLLVVEDCAQAHGATYKGVPVPVSGIGCFSFFPAKVLGAMGDAGAIVLDDAQLAEACRKLINHGRTSKYVHESEGFNHRMDALQAAILDVKLAHLPEWIAKRREHATVYSRSLGQQLTLQTIPENVDSAYYMFCIRTPQRDALKDHLAQKEIASGVHYPIPLHLQPAFAYLGYKEGDLPVAEQASTELLSIPLYPEMTEEQRSHIIAEITQFQSS